MICGNCGDTEHNTCTYPFELMKTVTKKSKTKDKKKNGDKNNESNLKKIYQTLFVVVLI